ncbi:MAG TPA: hypothetical protein VFN37_14340 [Candidatus Baltobacteraceae bacterium]|nr:hypothetical protein [Candidatus Baltobacteraceae bacterium]
MDADSRTAPQGQAGQKAGSLQGMFERGNTLLRAIVASEVLGPPAAFRENHLWTQQPNEPST